MLKRQKVKGSDQVRVTFSIPHDPAQGRVYVAGDFNNWSVSSLPLIKRVNDTRSASIVLDPGKRYAFRYFTDTGADSGEWFNDDEADDYELSEHGSKNCIIIT